eukprot:358811-Chlamydomonas_euryale.AAC.13
MPRTEARRARTCGLSWDVQATSHDPLSCGRTGRRSVSRPRAQRSRRSPNHPRRKAAQAWTEAARGVATLAAGPTARSAAAEVYPQAPTRAEGRAEAHNHAAPSPSFRASLRLKKEVTIRNRHRRSCCYCCCAVACSEAACC